MIYKPISRDEFINKIANWLPENKSLYLALLRMESEGKICFERQDGVPSAMFYYAPSQIWFPLVTWPEG